MHATHRITHCLVLAFAPATLILAGFSLGSAAGQAQQRARPAPPEPFNRNDSALVNAVPLRSIGPAVMSGRIVDIAVAESPGSRGGHLGTVIYVAAATGGVWKSTNGGVTWEPVFDDAGVGSIGDVTTSPSHSEIVWVGTGEPNNMRSSSYGDGVYKSTNGGRSFHHMGLRASQHIGRIVIHPSDPDIVYVAAVGPLWAAGGERGLYKTENGGQTWRAVLSVDQHTGVTDVAMDPTDPDILYAATLQRERRAYSYVGGGPGSGIYKSIDGGESWVRLADGLPHSDMGRIGLDVARSQPRTVYAVIEGSEEGVYRSDDFGGTWRQTSTVSSIPWYFGQIRVDPQDPEVVYHLGVQLQRSVDGGVTFERLADQVHADQHALWINPEDPHHLVLGNDGGLYVSLDRGVNWDFSPNLPVSQFYAVGLDMAEPFFGIHGGLQDNNTWGGPNRTRYDRGIVNADWRRMAGGDGFYAAIDPTDPDIAYVESQNGNLIRFNGRTGEGRPIRPLPPEGESPYRFNWSAPIKISPHDPNTVYFAANQVFKSTDRGDSWGRLGGDLTRGLDRDSLPMMGRVPDANAVSRHQGTAPFGNISALDVSSLRPGLLVAGTDDGMVSISRDDGETWRRLERFPGVPDTTYVSRVWASLHDEGTFYVTFDGHRSNDFRPYVLRTTDYGDSWTSVSSDLPEFGSVRAFAEHHENPELLFVGTEIAPFVSLNGGASWTRIRNGMPPVPVHDIKIHPRDNALVIATHGRGFFVLDDLGPLQYLEDARSGEAPFLFPVKSQLLLVPDGSRTSGTSADRDYRAPNPPEGVGIAFLLHPSLSSVTLEIFDASGERVRKLEPPDTPGLHVVQWDLRSDAPYRGPPQPERDISQGRRQGEAPGRSLRIEEALGPPVIPGAFTARLSVEGPGGPLVVERGFQVLRDPMVRLSQAEYARLREFRLRHAQAQALLTMARRNAEVLKGRIDEVQAAMVMGEVSESEPLPGQAAALEREIDDVLESLGSGSGRGRISEAEEAGPRTVEQLLAIAGGVNEATALPTRDEQEALEAATSRLHDAAAVLDALLERAGDFLGGLDGAGIPWTPGRPLQHGRR